MPIGDCLVYAYLECILVDMLAFVSKVFGLAAFCIIQKHNIHHF